LAKIDRKTKRKRRKSQPLNQKYSVSCRRASNPHWIRLLMIFLKNGNKLRRKPALKTSFSRRKNL